LHEPNALEWVAVLGLLGVTVAAVALTGFYQRWMFWSYSNRQRLRDQHPMPAVVSALFALFVLIEVFAAMTSVLAQSGWVEVSGFTSTNGRASESESSRASHSGSDIYPAMELFYVWQLLDAVPLLDLPRSLNWREPSHAVTDHVGGVFTVAFKVLVVLPVVALGVQVWSWIRREDSQP
jgi:hypothetical protein